MKTMKATLVLVTVFFMSTAFITNKKTTPVAEDYLCIYAYNVNTKQIIISNIFKCNKYEDGMGMLSDVTVGNFLKAEHDFKLEDYLDVNILRNPTKKYVYEDRLKKINDAKDNGYSIKRIKVSCKDGLVYDVY